MRRVELIPGYLNEFAVIDIRTELALSLNLNMIRKKPVSFMAQLQVFNDSGVDI
jgi:hypothetical protein